MKERVAVIGASSKPERYAYKAISQLQKHDHTPLPVSIKDDQILGEKTYRQISEVPDPIDTVTVYVNPKILAQMADDIIAKSPKRIIMNPGTESDELQKTFENHDISVQRACTLVLLSTGQFES